VFYVALPTQQCSYDKYIWSCKIQISLAGHYLFAPSAGRGATGTAIAELLSSEITPNYSEDECLEFWYIF